MPEEETKDSTTIQLKLTTVDRLKDFGRTGDSYETAMQNLLKIAEQCQQKHKNFPKK